MKIKRKVADLGNSTSQFMIEGYYFEMPSSCTEITREEAEAEFADAVDFKNLLKELVLRVKLNDQDRFFKVGEKAKKDAFGDEHIKSLHDKTKSVKTLVNWLAATVYYHVFKTKEYDPTAEDKVEIDFNLTMLPVWLLKRGNNFKETLQKMADRFTEPFEVELITPNFNRTLTIQVQTSKCRIEGETARLALKRDLELKVLDEADIYKDCLTIISDLGGQTHDVTLLPKDLKSPGGRDDFESFTDQTFLHSLDRLRKTKLMTHFTNVRDLEKFVGDNVSKRKFIYVNPTTGQTIDFTDEIEYVFKQFAHIVVENTLTAFELPSSVKVKIVWIGGVSESLQDYIKEYITEAYCDERLADHIFPSNARKLNIHALEIIAKDETLEVTRDGERTA